MKQIERFDIEVKAFNKDYFSTICKIKMPYILRAGDELFEVRYEGRGIRWIDAKILEVTDAAITIGDCYLWADKVFKLEFDQEPNYREILGEQYNIKEIEERQLIVQPFPVFMKKPNLKKQTIRTIEDFYHASEAVKSYEEYIRNFNNISNTQMSLL